MAHVLCSFVFNVERDCMISGTVVDEALHPTTCTSVALAVYQLRLSSALLYNSVGVRS